MSDAFCIFAVCDRCWAVMRPGKTSPALVMPEAERCGVCVVETRSGIYVRDYWAAREDGKQLAIFVVLRQPPQYPDGYVVRRVLADVQGVHDRMAKVAPTLDAARALVPPDRVLMARGPDDAPTVVETWL